MFKFIKDKITKVYNNFTAKIDSIFSNNNINDKFFEELKILLISADTGIKTTEKIIENLKNKIKNKNISEMAQVKEELSVILQDILNSDLNNNINYTPKILLLVGINGTGKTTFAAKLANKLKQDGKKVLLVAADTFRAAAVEQLQEWGKKIDVTVFAPSKAGDASGVVYDAIIKFKTENYDHIIIDTAGRLQTKVNLMHELEKVKRVIAKALGEIHVNLSSWLIIDAMLGQNSFEQAKIFKEVINLDGAVLTKLDGTGKGGMVFAIKSQLNLPILYVSFGEKLQDFNVFDSKEYVFGLLNQE
ncbi:MAG: Signal recognition particle-docking protein FtsY [candidate division TM6 bacterium GW2011_GWF2_28_16]|jgi:fused signal recognition particle receptor|nr:MAG: Signal recognition particle-docking protein FtsY [candidate division TM6 bacterium GW2011_GWF2_28_16]